MEEKEPQVAGDEAVQQHRRADTWTRAAGFVSSRCRRAWYMANHSLHRPVSWAVNKQIGCKRHNVQCDSFANHLSKLLVGQRFKAAARRRTCQLRLNSRGAQSKVLENPAAVQ